MIFEKITYSDDFPINIKIVNIRNYPLHYHQDIEFLYILKGEVRLKNVCHTYNLKEGDIFTNNGHEIHGMEAITKDNVVAIIQVSNHFFTQYFPALPKACFMTFVRNEKTAKVDMLRKMLINILTDYSYGSLNYTSKCISQMIDIIMFMNQNFNLFAFDGQVVISFKKENPVVINRISRIINYIYENHYNKISLEELAEIEHLSSYYLSHLIKDSMGINFQELLCFARIEMSELNLLETEDKISTIAQDVGFSTTSYYEKYFKKWFHCTPEEYRTLNTPKILSEINKPDYLMLSDNDAVSLIRRQTSTIHGQDKNSHTIHHSNFYVEIDPDITPIKYIEHSLEILITEDDYISIGLPLFHMISELNASNVVLLTKENGNTAISKVIINMLNMMGYNCKTASLNIIPEHAASGNDSIAGAIYLLRKHLLSDDKIIKCRLRDNGDSNKIFKGFSACLTSTLIPKPSFYAYKMLKNIGGDVLNVGEFYYVIKRTINSYIIVTINYNDKITDLTLRDNNIYEASKVINAFNDELNIDFSIPVKPGKYSIVHYIMSHEDSLFSYINRLGYSNEINQHDTFLRSLNIAPISQIDVKNVLDCLNVSSTIRGAGIHIIEISKI